MGPTWDVSGRMWHGTMSLAFPSSSYSCLPASSQHKRILQFLCFPWGTARCYLLPWCIPTFPRYTLRRGCDPKCLGSLMKTLSTGLKWKVRARRRPGPSCLTAPWEELCDQMATSLEKLWKSAKDLQMVKGQGVRSRAGIWLRHLGTTLCFLETILQWCVGFHHCLHKGWTRCDISALGK